MEKKPPVPLGWHVATLTISKVPDEDSPGGPGAMTDSRLPRQGGPGSIPGQGTSSHMLKLRVPTTKTPRSPINKCFKKIITKSLMDKKLC